jgi:hypothetical protein
MQIKEKNFIQFFLLLCLFLPAKSYAGGIVSQKGVATIHYNGKKISSSVKYTAYEKAQQNALIRYFAKSGGSETANFETLKNKIIKNLSSYILSARVISEQNHKGMHLYTVVVRVSINISAIDNVLKEGSSIGKTLQSKKSILTFIFVARRVVSKKNFETRKYRRINASLNRYGTSTVSHIGNEGQSLGGSHIGVSSSSTYSSKLKLHGSLVRESGGSNLRQANQIKWSIMNSQFLNSVFTGDFAKAGFEVVNVDFVAPQTEGYLDLSKIKKDYEHGNNISPATLNNAIKGLIIAKVPYVAIGTMDLGLIEKDPSTGLDRVFVTVTGVLYDLANTFPETIASVGPFQYSGLGPTENVAKINALKIAANKAAEKLISQINVAGVH